MYQTCGVHKQGFRLAKRAGEKCRDCALRDLDACGLLCYAFGPQHQLALLSPDVARADQKLTILHVAVFMV